MIKRYLIPIMAILVLGSGLLAGCTQEITTYYNHEFSYSVIMPKDWEVVKKPVSLITGRQFENTVVFRSEPSLEAQRVSVTAESLKSMWDIGDVGLSDGWEYKVYKYGGKGYLVESRSLFALGTKKWRTTYYIKHDKKLYSITFNDKGTLKKVRVSIDGYGEVKTNPPQ